MNVGQVNSISKLTHEQNAFLADVHVSIQSSRRDHYMPSLNGLFIYLSIHFICMLSLWRRVLFISYEEIWAIDAFLW